MPTARGVALLTLLALVGVGLVFASERGAPREVAYVVPAGTAARIAAGDAVNVLPAVIELRSGDTLVIRNDDSAPVQVGPYLVDPGQRLSHQYRSAGTYDLVCSVHPQGSLLIVVR